jgi:hypothetical protein
MVSRNCDVTVKSERALLDRLVSIWEKEVQYEASESRNKPILHSSFKKLVRSGPGSVVPYSHDFVKGIIRAFPIGLASRSSPRRCMARNHDAVQSLREAPR